MSLAGWALVAAMGTGCASSGAVPRPFPTPGGPAARADTPPADATTPPADATADHARPAGPSIADTALGLQGVPYRLGGTDPSGFDCSGLVQYVLARYGVSAPRVVREQFQLGRSVRDDIRPGDLIFFAVNSRRASHVGIALDGDRFVHAPATGQSVRVDSLSSSYWRARYAGARRVVPTHPVLQGAGESSVDAEH